MPILKYSSMRSGCIAAAFTVEINGTVIALVFILFCFLGDFDTFDSCWVECCALGERVSCGCIEALVIPFSENGVY